MSSAAVATSPGLFDESASHEQRGAASSLRMRREEPKRALAHGIESVEWTSSRKRFRRAPRSGPRSSTRTKASCPVRPFGSGSQARSFGLKVPRPARSSAARQRSVTTRRRVAGAGASGSSARRARSGALFPRGNVSASSSVVRTPKRDEVRTASLVSDGSDIRLSSAVSSDFWPDGPRRPSARAASARSASENSAASDDAGELRCRFFARRGERSHGERARGSLRAERSARHLEEARSHRRSGHGKSRERVERGFDRRLGAVRGVEQRDERRIVEAAGRGLRWCRARALPARRASFRRRATRGAPARLRGSRSAPARREKRRRVGRGPGFRAAVACASRASRTRLAPTRASRRSLRDRGTQSRARRPTRRRPRRLRRRRSSRGAPRRSRPRCARAHALPRVERPRRGARDRRRERRGSRGAARRR